MRSIFGRTIYRIVRRNNAGGFKRTAVVNRLSTSAGVGPKELKEMELILRDWMATESPLIHRSWSTAGNIRIGDSGADGGHIVDTRKIPPLVSLPPQKGLVDKISTYPTHFVWIKPTFLLG